MDLSGKKIVFFGDSITDTCKIFSPEYPYGTGYVNMLRADLTTTYLSNPPIIYNEGISGNKTEDLLGRIDDCLKHNADIVVLFIGINDVWHPYEAGGMPVNSEILGRIDELYNKISASSRVIIVTPFLFPIDEFFSTLEPLFESFRNAELKHLEMKGYEYIDMYKQLSIVSNALSKEAVTKDSVHPSILGHGVVAQTILDYLKNN